MSDYRRAVYYLYNYENGRKRNNVGFTRVEQMNGTCKIMSRIRVPSMNGKTLEVCLFTRERGEMSFLSLGKMQIRNMTGEFRVALEENDIMEMGYRLEEMKGMVIYESLQKFFGSEWDDQPIVFKEFKLVTERNRREKNISVNHRSLNEEKNIISPLPVKLVDSKEPETMQNDHKLLTASSAEEITCQKHTEKAEDDIVKEYKENIKNENLLEDSEKKNSNEKEIIIKEDLSEKKEEKREYSNGERLPNIFYQFPQMHPFEDDEMTNCVRIEPQDIGRLPMESWILANNSFLLHSYYSYRHLLLARRNRGSGFEYVLCAPGICQNREQFMAAMFGFCDFKPAKNVKDKNGEFGYWYMPITVEN